jgi:hypothetical protein
MAKIGLQSHVPNGHSREELSPCWFNWNLSACVNVKLNFFSVLVQFFPALLTQENAIQSEKEGQFAIAINQNAATNNIAKAFPFWLNGPIRPFKVMHNSRIQIQIAATCNRIRILLPANR